MKVPTGTMITGLITPVALCPLDCDGAILGTFVLVFGRPSKGQENRCARPEGHPDDTWGHICADCVSALIDEQQQS